MAEDKRRKLSDGTRAKSHYPEFQMPGNSYIRELIGFYEIIAEISPQGEVAQRSFQQNLELMSKEERKRFAAALRQTAAALVEAADAGEAKEGKNATIFAPIHIDIPELELGEIVRATLADYTLRPLKRESLVGRAFLIAAVSSFEILFSKLARVVCQHNPSALPKSDYAFTLEELTQYSSIDEAREVLITRRIDSLLMESIDGWAKWLGRTVSVDLSEIVGDWKVIREIFARRNILVHADGRISARYLQVLRSASIDVTGLTVGQELQVSRPYLEDALERLLALGTLLVFRIWSRLQKTGLNESAGWVVSNQNFLVRNQMWTAVQLVSDQFISVECLRSTSLALRINGWLASKRSKGVESIASEVSEWDTTGLARRYEMIKYLLLDEVELARPIVSQEIEGHRLSKFETKTHPLFIEYREYLSERPQTSSEEPEVSAGEDAANPSAD
jgi:hypothetical protein